MLTPQTLIASMLVFGVAASVTPTETPTTDTPAPEARLTAAQLTLTGVQEAMSNGDARGVSRYFGAEVQLQAGSSDGAYSRRQAEFMLRGFFKAHPPQSYETTTHTADGSVIGSYVSTQGSRYRVELVLAPVGNRRVVAQLRFVPD